MNKAYSGTMTDRDVETLIIALTDTRVIDALAKALQPSIQSAVQLAVQDKLDELNQHINVLATENRELRRRINDIESADRLDNIIIHGLKETFAETASGGDPTMEGETSGGCEGQFIRFCTETLGIDITPSDISVAHRLPKPKASTHSSGPRPMMVRFTNRKSRAAVLAAKKKLRHDRNNKIYINEHLTKHSSEIYAEARKMLKNHRIAGAWTRNCNVYVKALESKGSKISMIDSVDALRNFC